MFGWLFGKEGPAAAPATPVPVVMPGATYKAAWEVTGHIPTVGTGNVAFTTYGVPMIDYRGRGGVNPQRRWNSTPPAQVASQQVVLTGLAQANGQFYFQPLFDPNGLASGFNPRDPNLTGFK